MWVPLKFLRTEADCLARMALVFIILVQLIGSFVGRSMDCSVEVKLKVEDDTGGGECSSIRMFQW